MNVVNGNRKCLSIEAIHHQPGNCRIYSPTVNWGNPAVNLILSFVCKLPSRGSEDLIIELSSDVPLATTLEEVQLEKPRWEYNHRIINSPVKHRNEGHQTLEF